MVDDQRAALAFIAIITGVMGCIQGVLSMRAGSTAMLADALIFVNHSASATITSWTLDGKFSRSRLVVQLQGLVMLLLGAAVLAAVVRRVYIGSAPRPATMMILGCLALGASLTCSAIVLRQRGAASTLAAVWKLSTSDAVSNVAVVAAGALVALTASNIPDLVIGGAMAGYFALKGWRVMVSGRIVDPRSP